MREFLRIYEKKKPRSLERGFWVTGSPEPGGAGWVPLDFSASDQAAGLPYTSTSM